MAQKQEDSSSQVSFLLSDFNTRLRDIEDRNRIQSSYPFDLTYQQLLDSNHCQNCFFCGSDARPIDSNLLQISMRLCPF
jgi:hypothetical protein